MGREREKRRNMLKKRWKLKSALSALIWAIICLMNTHLASDAHAILSSDWLINKDWESVNKFYLLEIESQKIVDSCRSSPDSYIKFPVIIQGAHQILLDGKMIKKFGEPDFKKVRSYYGVPTIQCKEILQGKVLTWKAFSYIKEFARTYHFPYITHSEPNSLFYSETLNIIATGGLFILSIFCLVIFWKKVPVQLVLSLVMSNFFLSIYFLLTVPEFFNISIEMIMAHKLSDSFLWLGICLFINTLRLEGLFHRNIYFLYLLNIAIGIIFILKGQNGDDVQYGTSLPFVLTIILLLIGIFKLLKNFYFIGFSRKSIFQFLSFFFYSAMTVNDILVVSGFVEGEFLYSLGVLGGLLFLTLSVNEKIIETFQERDFLRANLEKEVERKTNEISQKTCLLEKALTDLKSAQADLIQSEKLASLGTLSAGIAHEINNSLNYVNGALAPLEKFLEKVEITEGKKKIETLIKIMKDGLNLTFEIIKSLRNYTGLNQAKFKDVHLLETVQSVITIVSSKIKKNQVEIKLEIDPQIIIYADHVGLNQIFMNIIVNAIDAMPKGGILIVRSSVSELENTVNMEFIDNGMGIPKPILERIFDPFFTTKEVGKGTGIGLHIVKNQIEKHQGKIQVVSSEGKGSTFKIQLPMRAQLNEDKKEMAS